MPQDNSTSSSTLTEETLRRQNQYLAALQETALGLVSRLELNELLQDIVSRAGALVGTNNGYVFLLNPETDEMTMRVGVGVYENFVGTRATRGDWRAAQVTRTRFRDFGSGTSRRRQTFWHGGIGFVDALCGVGGGRVGQCAAV